MTDEPKDGLAQHGRDCPKVPHIGHGYLHDAGDDRPYDVDGVAYCGRCHGWMGSGPARARASSGPRPQEEVTTYTPMLWATLSEDERYAEYVRVRNLVSAETGIAVRLLNELVEKWQSQTEHNRREQDLAWRDNRGAAAALLGHRIEVRMRCADDLAALLVSPGCRQEEKEEEDQARVDRQTGSAHGDLPRRPTR